MLYDLIFQLTFGIFITNILGALLGWFFNSIVLGVLHTVFSVAVFVFLPQTPFDLARQGKYAELHGALIKSGSPQDEAIILKQVAKEETSVGYLTTVKQLNKRNLLIVLAVFILSQLSGISIVTTYLVDIFADSSALDPLLLLIAASLSGILAAIFQTIVADFLGRKTFLVISGLGTGATTLLLASTFWANKQPNETILGSSTLKSFLANDVFLVSILVLYRVFFNLGFGPIRYTLQSELFTAKEQETVGSISQTTWWVFGFLATKLFHALSLNFGFTAIFTVIAAICFLSVAFTTFAVPETRVNKQEEAIGGDVNAGIVISNDCI